MNEFPMGEWNVLFFIVFITIIYFLWHVDKRQKLATETSELLDCMRKETRGGRWQREFYFRHQPSSRMYASALRVVTDRLRLMEQEKRPLVILRESRGQKKLTIGTVDDFLIIMEAYGGTHFTIARIGYMVTLAKEGHQFDFYYEVPQGQPRSPTIAYNTNGIPIGLLDLLEDYGRHLQKLLNEGKHAA